MLINLVSPQKRGTNVESRLRLIDDMLENNATIPLAHNSATQTEMTIHSSILHMEQGSGVDVFFLSQAMTSCGSKRDLSGGIQHHCLAITTGLIASVYVGSSLISLYTRYALLGDAYRVFKEMPVRNVVSWTTIIAGFAQEWSLDVCLELFQQMRGSDSRPNCFTEQGCCHMEHHDHGYAQHGLAHEAIILFEEMIKRGVNPDTVTHLGVLSSCRHGGLVKEGQVYFNSMVEHGVQPELDHYSCIVDLLGWPGLLLGARDFIQNMPIFPNAVIWGSLLSFSRLHGNVQIGIQAAESR
ncbi:Pentatricopeptide repeat-containing protein [Glycine max]|nr:Pentatricopeptide repeat-containing protein [Glycine max]